MNRVMQAGCWQKHSHTRLEIRKWNFTWKSKIEKGDSYKSV